MTGENSQRPATTDVRKILEKRKGELMKRPNLNGVGITQERTSEGEPRNVIQVYVSRKLPPEELSAEEMVPRELDGVKVRVREIGPIYVG